MKALEVALLATICLGCFALGKYYEAAMFTPVMVTSCTDDYTKTALKECQDTVNEVIEANNTAGKLVNALVDFIWTAECIDLKIIQEEPRPKDMVPLPRFEDRIIPPTEVTVPKATYYTPLEDSAHWPGTNHPSGELY